MRSPDFFRIAQPAFAVAMAGSLALAGCSSKQDAAPAAENSSEITVQPDENLVSCEPLVIADITLDPAEKQSILANEIPEDIANMQDDDFFALRFLAPEGSTEGELAENDNVINAIFDTLKPQEAVQFQTLLVPDVEQGDLDIIAFGVPEGCPAPMPEIAVGSNGPTSI